MSTTQTLTFSSTMPLSAQGTGAPAGVDYNLPAALDPGFTTSFNRGVGTVTVSTPAVTVFGVTIIPPTHTTTPGININGNVSFHAGLTGSLDLTLGQYTPNIPINIGLGLPTQVTDGSTFTIDPTLISTNDATFSLTGPGAQLALDVGLSGAFTLNIAGTPVFSQPEFGANLAIPTSHAFSFPDNTGSIVLAEPASFTDTSGAGTGVGTNFPTLTASGTDSPAFLSATGNLVGLLALAIPELKAITNSIDVGIGTVNYSLLSAPLTGSLSLNQTVTLTPEGISVTVTDDLNSETRTGALGTNFTFDAPTSGSGTIPITARYTLELGVQTSTGITGNLSLSIDGPQFTFSTLGGLGKLNLGPFGSVQAFDLSTDLGTVVSENFTQPLTQIENYNLPYEGTAACYARGTRLRTLEGEVAIEDLAVDDSVLTAAGDARPVRWVGHRPIDCTRHPNPRAVWPILIRAGAFADGLPIRDLLVSPGHALLIDGALVQAENLVNGVTVVQVPRERVEYWHVELERHDIVLAEGLAAETYLDTGNRTDFVNGGAFLELYPDFKPRHWNDTCAPLALEGPAVHRAKAALLARAHALGHRTTADAEAHILADGQRIEPVRLGETRLAFMLPAASSILELRCRGFVGAHIRAESIDTRVLGLCVGRLQLDGVDVALDDAVFTQDWHPLEKDGEGRQWRWSPERMTLPAGTRLVVIDTYHPGYYWVAPESGLVADEVAERVA